MAQEEAGVTVLDKITVNARKIKEPVQRIPFGISVFDRGSIERQDLRDAREVGRVTPGFNFVDTGIRGSNIPNVRGVGSFFPQSADDTSVPVFIDGVPVPVRAQDRDFFDVQRIEILRGPQNTIYGRNAQAGAINITTANPEFEPRFEFGGEIGNFASRRGTALANVPLNDTIAARLALQYDTRNGDIEDLNTSNEARDQDLAQAHGKVLWFPSDNTDVTLAFRYGHYDEQPTQGVWFEDPKFPQLFLDEPQDYELETLGGGLTVVHDFENLTLTSVTGVQNYSSDFFADDTDGLIFNGLTGLPPATFNDPGFNFRTIEDRDTQLSQELRLDGELDNGIRWLAGVNAFRSDFDLELTFNSTGFINGEFNNDFTTTSFAGFGELTVPITDKLQVLGGFRYTHEIKDFDGDFMDLSGGTLGANASENESLSFDLVTGRAAVTYDIAPDVTAFASFSRGAKAGGFQLADTDVRNGFRTSTFESAFTHAYEAGIRGSLFDDKLDFSLSGFFNDTKDEHVQVFQALTFQSVIENLDTETYGFELEGAVRPLDGLTFSGGLALLETEITNSEDPTVREGNEVPFAPSITFDLAAEYEHSLPIFGLPGDLFGRAEYQFVGSRSIDPQDNFDLAPFDLVNLRAGWDSDYLSVYAFVTNLLDESYAETAFLFGVSPATGQFVSVASPGQPRRFGVGARVRF